MTKKASEEKQLLENWLRFASENLMAAEALIQEEYGLYHTVCFMCQSAAEKYLKAYLISQGWPLEKTHDLKVLLKHCLKYNQSFQVLDPDCNVLNEYIVEGRYPGDLAWEAISKAEAIEALEAARRIATFVGQELQGQ